MREQKYKDILERYEEELRKAQEEKEINEEKLSMTRELKFKDLQEHLNDDQQEDHEDLSMTREMKFLDKVKEASEYSPEEYEDEDDEDEIVDRENALKESALIERELDEALKRERKKANDLKVKEINEEPEEKTESKITDDDIYLTTSFKPFRKRFRFRKVFKVLFSLIFIVGVLGAFTYFVAYPVYNKLMDSRPKIIFDRTVDFMSNKFTQLVDIVYYEDDVVYNDINFNLDSNIEGLDILKDYTFGIRFGINPTDLIYEDIVYVKDDNEKYGFYSTEKDNHLYVRMSNSDNYLDLGEVEEDSEFYKSYKEYLDELKLSQEDTIYVIEKEFSFLKEMLESDLITSSKDELDVMGEKVKVTRNSYTLDKKEAAKIEKKYYELVSADKKLVKILAELEEVTEEEYLEQLEEDLKKEYEDDYKFAINIYTTNGNKFVGIDVEENGFRNFYLYTRDGNFTLYFNFTKDSDCLEGKDCVASNRKVFELNGTKKSDFTEVEVKYNNVTYATLEVKEFSDEEISLNYKVEVGNLKLNGDFMLLLNMDKREYDLDFSVNFGENYVRLKLFLGLKQDEIFGYVDEDKVLKYTDKLFEEEWNEFANILEKKSLDEGYMFWYMVNYHPEEIFALLLADLGYDVTNISDEAQSM